jgi:four helix bundle protein
MFDFEKLTVYKKAKEFDRQIIALICSDKFIDKVIANQLKRASLSIPLNIAEGTGRYSKADIKNFYVIARGSTFQCIAIFDILKDRKNINTDVYTDFYNKAEELSMMLFAMIKRLC